MNQPNHGKCIISDNSNVVNSIINQDDRPIIVEQILRFYRKSWEEYDKEMLKEQLEDIKTNLNKVEVNSLTKEQLVNILINNDREELNQKSYYELSNEIKDYLTKTY